MYSVFISKEAAKFLKKLDKNQSEAILKKIYSIKEEPFSHLKKIKGSKLWRLRVMKYRAIIEVIFSKKELYVVSIGHRKNVY